MLLDKNDRAVGKSRKKVLSKFKKRKVKEKSYVDAADADRIPTGNETKAILTGVKLYSLCMLLTFHSWI